MSASSKKKLRKESEAAKMTEKQLAAQKEAKTTKLYTTAFVVVLTVLLVVAVIVGVNQTLNAKGIREKNTVAVTVGDHEINSVELNYFYMDTVNNFLNTYGSMASLIGLSSGVPLDEQIVDEETGTTWADDFLASAKANAQSVYAMCDAAEAAGFELSAEELTEIEYQVYTLDTYAVMYGYENGDAYLKAMYGNGADRESYLEYSKRSALASAYYTAYGETLTYTEADLRAVDAQDPKAYNAYSYNYYYLSTAKFRTGGTTDAEGNTTYSAEETAAAVAAAEEAAKALTDETITSVADLDAAIAALPVNAEATVSSSASTDVLYSAVSGTYKDWVTDNARKAGDKTYVPYTSTDADGNETVNGYYVVYFVDSTDNNFPLVNVRHILIQPEHVHAEGETHEDGETYSEGETHEDGETYSEAELAAAKTQAEALLKQWTEGDATEEAFAELANANSADGDGVSGGLYENVYPGQMVANFNDWCFAEGRKAGDTGIVETEYGFHIMYYVGDADITYRDYQIESSLRSSALTTWYNETVAAMTVTDGNTKYVQTDLVLNAQ